MLFYADNIAPLSLPFSNVQERSDRRYRFACQVGLISPNETEVSSVNISKPISMKIVQLCLPLTQHFTDSGRTVCYEGGANLDIRQRTGRARRAFTKLPSLWRSRKNRRNTKIRIYQAFSVDQNIGEQLCRG